MPERTLVERAEILEQKVEGLQALPDRVHAVELQIVQLREEMRAGFSALRAEFGSEIGAAGDSIKGELRSEIRAGLDSVRNELRGEIRAGDEETRRYMRVLHEEVISRIATIGEARPRRPKR